jgi:hypothetical protein
LVTLAKKSVVHTATYVFQSDAKTVEEAFSAIHQAGFICVRKNHLGKIVPAGNYMVSLASGDF